MKTIDAIRSRRAVKHYDADHRMTDAEVTELLSLALLSPTAFNIQSNPKLEDAWTITVDALGTVVREGE